MEFIKKPLSQPDQYQAVNPVFITTIIALAEGFPWERLTRYFSARPVLPLSVSQQVFMMRILAIQEMLCLKDREILHWVKRQMYVFSLVDTDDELTIPALSTLVMFRAKLDETKILEPFRRRCQQLVLKHETPSAYEQMRWASEPSHFLDLRLFDDLIPPTTVPKLAVKDAESLDMDVSWVTCPQCDSARLNDYVPEQPSPFRAQPWASCRQCGHTFEVD